MTVLLIVVPDYASHYFPMSAIAQRVVALRNRSGRCDRTVPA